jgi:hypothetical protein
MVLVLPALLAGCGTEDRSTTATKAAASVVVATPEKVVLATAPARTFECTGVEACDELLHVYDRCVRKKLTGRERDSNALRLDELRAATSKRAKSGEGADVLAASCKRDLETLPTACGR